MRTRVGIAGLGAISRFFLNAIRGSADWELVAVCDRHDELLAAARGDGVRAVPEPDELLAIAEVDAVIICLPNDLHYASCCQALATGKHVCCEKPLALTSREAADLNARAERHQRTLFTAFHRRYNANVLAAKAEIGDAKVRRITARYLEMIEEHSGADTWYLDAAKSGGGCITDNGPNVFDSLAMFIPDLEVRTCRIEAARGAIDLRAQVELADTEGATAEVLLDWAYDGERKDLEIELADGRCVAADMLAGFDGFKASLDHEYVGVMAEFGERIGRGQFADVEGAQAVALVESAYRLAAVDQAIRSGEPELAVQNR